MSEELKNTLKYLKNKSNTRRIKTITINEAHKVVEEIERLNNIINELEKWLEEQHQFIIEIPAYTKEISIEHKTMEICYENVLDKLQELLGSDKE